MYILKNAFLNIIRTKGRTLLISLIILTISISACIGLSIRQAAETAKEESLDKLNITSQISIDRKSLMQNSGGKADKTTINNNLNNVSALTIDDMLKYAEAESVDSFYYTRTLSLNGSGDFNPIDTSSSETLTTEFSSDRGNLKGFSKVQGDFTIIGYSSNDAMTDFTNGTSTIVEGNMFEYDTSNLDCIISDELATYNSLSVGDSITVSNPNDETEIYTLNIVGIYNNSQSTVTNSSYMSGFSAGSDPANQIYLSYNAADSIAKSSSANASTTVDTLTGFESSSAITSQTSGTYVFASIDDYNSFDSQARELGLDEVYTISSADINAYEQSLIPLNNLSTMAGYFLIVVIAIGALVLIILNIFSVRERKYEVGVLTAIGMKKWKVATQFIVEILIISLISVGVGGAIGAVSSVSVTNSLLESQIIQTQEEVAEMQTTIGNSGNKFTGSFSQNSIKYISSVSSAVNLTVLLQLLGVFILLTIVSSAVSVIFIMRYEPLKILSNRD